MAGSFPRAATAIAILDMVYRLSVGVCSRVPQVCSAGVRRLTQTASPPWAGAETAPAVVELGRKLNVDLPICQVVLDMIEGRLDARAAVGQLLNRPMKDEI